MKTLLIILSALFLFGSCNRVKKEGGEIIRKSKQKTQETWSAVVDKARQVLISYEKTSFEKSFGYSDSLNVTEINGIRNDQIISFYEGFLVYEADKDTILNYFSNLYTRLPDISDDSIKVSDTNNISEKLKEFKTDNPELFKDLSFFNDFQELDSISVYKCNKYPLSHQIIIDENSRRIYHYYENYWD